MIDKNKKGFLANSIKGLKIMFKANPRMLLLYSFFTAISGAFMALQTVFTQSFLDTAQSMILNKSSISSVILALIIMGIIRLFSQVMHGVSNCYGRITEMTVIKHINKLIFQRVDKLDNIEFEDTKRLDYINKAVNGSNKMVWLSMTLLEILLIYVIYFIVIGWYLFTLKPILVLSIIIAFIPAMLSNIIQTSLFGELESKSAPIRRENQYYESCVIDVKETRLLGATLFFNNKYLSSLKKLNGFKLKAQLKKNIISLLLDALTALGYIIIIYMITIAVLNQEISVGAFASVFSATSTLFSFMQSVITFRISQASKDVATVENFFSFINEDIHEKVIKPKPKNCNIELQNVSFQYPTLEQKAICNINLVIHDGETLAIVGENGSGKTTLCRMIMGLYQPTEGQVLYGDIPTKNLDFKGISAVFQKYCQYKMLLKENISISQIDKSMNEKELKNICKQSGVNLTQRNKGLYTMLGRDFDGEELSGGQWQRIAIARGLFRDSDMIVLDEPTAAIDPLEETRLYNDFIRICNSKTSIIVTHRMGSTKIADRIIVMKNGEIVQDGKHENLINTEGEYKRMYEAQRKWYKE